MKISNKLQKIQTSLTKKQRGVLLVLVVVAVLGLLTATVFRSNIASMLRWMTYSQANDNFAHNAQSSSLFLGLEDNLLICTQTQIQMVSPTGVSRLKESVSMKSPALNSSGDYAVVYDVGGQELRLIGQDAVLHSLTLPAEETFLCATVNEKGWVAVTTKISGYKGVVTVYNRDFSPVLTIRLSSRYISDAVVTPDCRGVYLISPGQAEGAFENTLLYYTFSSREKPTRTISLGSNVVLSIRSAGRCWIMGDRSLLILDSSGVITGRYDYEDRYLKLGTLQGNGFATLFLSRSSSGSTGTLVTVGADGKPYGQIDLEGQTMALAAQGHDVALLTTGKILTADRKLERYATSPNQQGIRNLAVYEDGTVALINSAAVSLYFPFNGEKVEVEKEAQKEAQKDAQKKDAQEAQKEVQKEEDPAS